VRPLSLSSPRTEQQLNASAPPIVDSTDCSAMIECSKSDRHTHLAHIGSAQMGSEVCWRVTSVSGDVVCTIHGDDEGDVEVRAAFSDGTVVRRRRASNIETGRIVAALWLDAIRDEFAIR
jgi:hypothetical protein